MKRLPRAGTCGLWALLMPALMVSVADSSHIRTIEGMSDQVVEQMRAVEPVRSHHEATYAKQDALPSQVLILAVPFMSWEEASRLDYINKDILNPSAAATIGMILQYWGEDINKLQDQEALLSWATWESGNAQSLDDLKPWLAQDIPVIVTTGLTPAAHPLYSVARVMAAVGAIPEALIEPQGPTSGMLGPMTAYDAFEQMEALVDINFVTESVLLSTRVVVGYDDAREIITLHDPKFGPAWEVSYEDFESMWAATRRAYSAAHPANYVDILSQRLVSPNYSSRTPDQQAAEQYILGYALAAVGNANQAADHFRQGLAIPGISRGYQHLLQFELAIQLFSWQGKPEETLPAFKQAIDFLPENPAPWQYLAQIYTQIGWSQEARAAKQKAEQFCSSQEAQSRLFEVLPADLRLYLPCQ